MMRASEPDAGLPLPLLESLLNRLAACPADFLAEPRIWAGGSVHVPAVVSDLLIAFGRGPLTVQEALTFTATDARVERNRLRLVLIAAWLLADPQLSQRAGAAEGALRLLAVDARDLAGFGAAEIWVENAERREELVRRCLAALGLRPRGETAAQAEDRLATLDSVSRQRVIEAARQAEERSRAVREAMAKKAAYEASLKVSRE